MTDANDIRRIMRLMERSAEEYQGPRGSQDISYSAEETKGEITKVVATLKSYDSGRYTKLGRNLLRVEALEKEIKILKEETKGEARELVADLFHAEDAACTRVVDTVSFVFQMTKDPKATETVKYAKVLEELQSKLTPELVTVLEGLIEKHKSAPVQKAAALKATDKEAPTEESINEGMGDKLKGFFASMLTSIQRWGKGYDNKLAALKAQVGLNEATEKEPEKADDKPARPKLSLFKKRTDEEGDDEPMASATPSKVNPRTSSEVRFTEKDLRAAHKDGYEKGRRTPASYKGGYSASMWDLSSARAAMGLGPRAKTRESWDGTGDVRDASPTCQHEWHEGVDDNGELAEPPYDVCYHCGATRH